MKILTSITGTRNLFVNIATAFLLSIVIVGVLAIIGEVIYNVGSINGAKF